LHQPAGHIAGRLARHLAALPPSGDDQVGVARSRVIGYHFRQISVRGEDRQLRSHTNAS